MNFLNLEYFLVAAEELNFTKAAKRLFISQQSLSNHISKLEQYYQVPLFDRHPPLSLTVAGKCLMRRAKDIVSLKNQTAMEIRDIKDFRTGDITIGITHSRGHVFLPLVLPIYHESFPNIKLNLFEGNSDALEDALHTGKVDLIVGFLPKNTTNVKSVPLYGEDFLMLIPKKIIVSFYPDCYEKLELQLTQTIDFQLIKDCPFIVMSPNTKVGDFSSLIFKKYDISPNIVLETQNIETMLALCMAEMGIALCPEIFISSLTNYKQLDKILLCPLDSENARTVIAISYLSNKYITQATQEFIKTARNAMLIRPSHDILRSGSKKTE